MSGLSYALPPSEMLRSIDASRDTLGRARMKLIDVVEEVTKLSGGAPYAVVGGMAQILWARKTHTDDLDVVLAAGDLAGVRARVGEGRALGWALPQPPDRSHEENQVFEVEHLLFHGSVVDLLCYRNASFTAEILATAVTVSELQNIRFARPELLLVMQLLRPGPLAALAATELLLARRAAGQFDADYAAKWAMAMGRSEGLRRAVARADELSQSE